MLLSAALLALTPLLAVPEWFEGSLEQALARAAAEERLVMVELGTGWERDCRRLRETLASDELTAALGGLLCVSLDAESPGGAVLAYRQRVATYPTLLFLEPDGTVRDRLEGFWNAARLGEELARIGRNEGTLSALRAELAARPDDLDLRYELVLKLRLAGDLQESEAQAAEIRRRDPGGTSRASLRMDFDAVHRGVFDALLKWEEPDWEGLARMSEELDDPELKFRGLAMLAYANDIEGVRARNGEKLDEVQPHLRSSRAYYERAWALVPPEAVSTFGNELAWNFWEDAQNLTVEEKALAVEAAERAHAAMPDESSIMDTLACCYFMSGQVERAREVVARCRELDPERSALWDERSALFGGE